MIATNKLGQSLHNGSTQYIYTAEENRNCDLSLTLVTSKKIRQFQIKHAYLLCFGPREVIADF